MFLSLYHAFPCSRGSPNTARRPPKRRAGKMAGRVLYTDDSASSSDGDSGADSQEFEYGDDGGLPYIVEQILREIFGRYLLCCGTEKEIGHDTENSIERYADNDFLGSDKFYFEGADVGTKTEASSYLANIFQRVDHLAGHQVESITMFFFLHVYETLWTHDRQVVVDHLTIHGWHLCGDGGRFTSQPQLRYCHRGLGLRGANHFAVHFRDHLPLVELNLAGNEMGSEGVDLSVFFMSISHLRHITSLNMSGNNIVMDKEKNMRSKHATLQASLLMGLRTHHRSLRHVNLSHNRIKGAIVEAILKSNNGIEDLDMSNNSLGNEDGVAMARGIAMSKHLKALRLCENKLGTIGVYAIAAAIRNNKRVRARLTSLDLGGNPLGKQGADAIAELISGNSSLLELRLRSCELAYRLPTEIDKLMKEYDASGLLKIIGCLGYNRSLTAVDLSQNACPNEMDGKRLSDQLGRLATLGSLTDINISRMQLQDEAIECFCSHLFEGTRFVALRALEKDMQHSLLRIDEDIREEEAHYVELEYGPVKGEKHIQAMKARFEVQQEELRTHRNAAECGIKQKRVLPEHGEAELNRVRKLEDQAFVRFKKQLTIMEEQCRSEDLRHDTRLRHFEEKRATVQETYAREKRVLHTVRARCSLTALNIEGNAFTGVGACALSKLLLRHNVTLARLHIGGNVWGRSKALSTIGSAIGGSHYPGVLTRVTTTLNSAGLPLHRVWASMVELDLSNCRLVCNDACVLGNVLKHSEHRHCLERLNLSKNFLWHTTSDRVRGDPSGFNELFGFVKVAERLLELDVSYNFIESSKDADSVCLAIGRALGVMMFKGKTHYLPICPLQRLSMEQCGLPASKDAHDILLRNLERTWAIRFFHKTLEKAWPNRSEKFDPRDTRMPLTIVGRTDGDIALQILQSHPHLPLSSWKTVKDQFYKLVVVWTGSPCQVEFGLDKSNSGRAVYPSVQRTLSRTIKDGRYPEDYAYASYGKNDVPEAKEQDHVREMNNAAFEALSKGLDWTSEHWLDDVAEDEHSPAKLAATSPATMQTQERTVSPIKRRKGRRLHRVTGL